jgi:hypothetical protein
VSLTPHAHINFQTASKSENHMQNRDGMQKKFKMHAVSMTPRARCIWCHRHRMQNMTPHARSTNDSNGPGSL